MSSKTEHRANEILQLLLHHGKTSVEELTEHFATSAASVRRDLARLEQQGLVHRTHGGAMLAGQTYEPFRFDASFKEREGRFPQEKQHIAAMAAALIGPDESIGLTAGTTTTQLARSLCHRSDLRILTNAVNIGMELSVNSSVETTLTGGCMRWPSAFSLIGPTALESVQVVLMDKLFLGVCGIHPEHGASTIQADEAQLFRVMCRRARQVIVLADSSKAGMTSPAVICPVTEIDVLVTDGGISEDCVAAFRRQGVEVLIAGEDAGSVAETTKER